MRTDRTPVEVAKEYRALAESCLNQAKATLDQKTAGVLRRMGEEYLAKAEAIEGNGGPG